MIIYNITIKVEWSIARDWEKWMTDTHIPEVLKTGCFQKHQLVKLLQIDNTDGPTYAVQYYAVSLKEYDKFIRHHAPAFLKMVTEKWGQSYVDFQTLMEVID